MAHSYNPSYEDVSGGGQQHLQPGDAYGYPPRPAHQRTDSGWSDHTVTGPQQGSPLIKPVAYSDYSRTPMASQDELGAYDFAASRDALAYAGPNAYGDKPAWSAQPPARKSRKRLIVIIAAAVVLLIIIAAVVIYFVAIKPKQDDNKSSSGGSKNGTSAPVELVVGKDGTQVTTEDGKNFTYANKFGGWFIDDPVNPYNDGAQPNSWTPPLNQSWKFGQDKIFGCAPPARPCPERPLC